MKIDHVAAYFLDLEGAKEFFEKYFGCKSNEMYHNTRTGLRTYIVTFPDGGRLEIMSRPEVTASDFNQYTHGFIHMSVSVGSKESVDNLTKELADAGYEVMSGPRVTGDGYYESSVRAFEDLIIEITV